mmetsp:Transcript_77481/g.224823  ORF Transcript_77481/g.224823 Transcript_77481/m.224823 type:complete len:301 (+) Transcript_77481:2777-3679(+)
MKPVAQIDGDIDVVEFPVLPLHLRILHEEPIDGVQVAVLQAHAHGRHVVAEVLRQRDGLARRFRRAAERPEACAELGPDDVRGQATGERLHHRPVASEKAAVANSRGASMQALHQLHPREAEDAVAKTRPTRGAWATEVLQISGHLAPQQRRLGDVHLTCVLALLLLPAPGDAAHKHEGLAGARAALEEYAVRALDRPRLLFRQIDRPLHRNRRHILRRCLDDMLRVGRQLGRPQHGRAPDWQRQRAWRRGHLGRRIVPFRLRCCVRCAVGGVAAAQVRDLLQPAGRHGLRRFVVDLLAI